LEGVTLGHVETVSGQGKKERKREERKREKYKEIG